MVSVNREKCGYCGACVSVCPSTALELVELHLRIEDEKCISCGLCVKICPMGALEA
ncbi:MAG: 4Fe-4S binding protein [Archaeoglobi archaeon]|nr:4Fe-4S binding protein [Candidatus Mnemosynella sp.]